MKTEADRVVARTSVGEGAGLLAASPDGELLAVSRPSGPLGLLTPGGRLDRTVGPERAAALGWFPDGRSLLVGGEDGTRLDAWDGREAVRYAVNGFVNGHASDGAVTPDGRAVILAASRGAVLLFDAATGARVRRFAGHRGEATCVAVSPDGRIAASGGSDGAIYLWELGEPASGR